MCWSLLQFMAFVSLVLSTAATCRQRKTTWLETYGGPCLERWNDCLWLIRRSFTIAKERPHGRLNSQFNWCGQRLEKRIPSRWTSYPTIRFVGRAVDSNISILRRAIASEFSRYFSPASLKENPKNPESLRQGLCENHPYWIRFAYLSLADLDVENNF